jgi:hypothetical protein
LFTTIARYPDPIEAHIACGRLRAEGIDAHVADDGVAVANWEWRLAVGGTRLRVPETQAERARRVLGELDAGGFALDADNAAAAALHAPEYESPSSRIAWVALMLFGIPLPWRRRSTDDAVREM